MLVVGTALAGCVDRKAQEQARDTESLIKDPTVLVSVMTVASAAVEDTLEVTGSIQTSEDVQVSASVSGLLAAVYVRDGENVSAGQIIAQLADNDYRTQVMQARAQVAVSESALSQAESDAAIGPMKSAATVEASESKLAQAQAKLDKLVAGSRPEEKRQAQAMVDKAKSDLDTALLARDRARRLKAEGAISQSDLEQAENAYASASSAYESVEQGLELVLNSSRQEDIVAAEQEVRAATNQVAIDEATQQLDVLFAQRVQSAKSSLELVQHTQRRAEIALASTKIYAPFAGRISGNPLQAGAYVSPGVTIARIIGVSGAYFEAEVPESDIAKIEIGSVARVVIGALSESEINGTVSAVNPVATETGRLYLVRVALGQLPAQIKAGMFGRAMVVMQTRDGVHVVPSDAIIRRGDDAFVFLMDGDSAVRVSVQLGPSAQGSTEVLGLSDGDVLIVKGQDQLGDGTKVRLQSAADSAE